jgi:hypothetical protein
MPKLQNPASQNIMTGERTEPAAAIITRPDGTKTFQMLNGHSQASNHADKLVIKLPAGSSAGDHGHLEQDDHTRTIADRPHENSGWGDASTMKGSNPKPDYTTAGNRLGVHDAPDGHLHFQMIKGQMTREEASQVNDALNVEQETLEESMKGKPK